MKKRQIIALGGGGFSMEPDNPLLDNYILYQTKVNKPKICFIPTASGDSKDYINRFYTHFETKPCTPSHLSLFHGHSTPLEDFVMQQDVLYVGGGNTRNLMTLWREWGLDKMIRKAYENGTILAGISAGMICWFEQGLTDSIPGTYSPMECMGILEGSACPHFDGEGERQAIFRELIQTGKMKSGYACDDSVGLHFVNEQLERVISSVEGKFAYEMMLVKWDLLEEKLVPDYLETQKKVNDV